MQSLIRVSRLEKHKVYSKQACSLIRDARVVQGVKKAIDPSPFKSIFQTIVEIFIGQLTEPNKSKLMIKVYIYRSGLKYIRDPIRAPEEVKMPILGSPLFF